MAALISFSVLTAVAPTARGETYGYNVASGNWTTGANWTNSVGGTGVAPGVSDTAYIGSTYPAGSTSSAVVDITSAISASAVYLGNGGGDSGTINLHAGGSLSLSSLSIGPGAGVINRLGGTLQFTSLILQGSNFSVLSIDTINAGASFDVQGTGTTLVYNNSPASAGASATVYDDAVLDLQGGTLYASNLQLGNNTAGTLLRNGGALNLGGAAALVGSVIDILATDTMQGAGTIQSSGAGSTINYNNTALSAWGTTYVENDGTLNLQGGTFSTSGLQVGGATAGVVTRNGGLLDVTGTLSLSAASTLNLAAGDSFDGASITLNDTSNLNLAGNNLNAFALAFQGGSLTRGGGNIDVTHLNLGNSSSFSLIAGDNLQAGGSITVNQGSTLDINTATPNLLGQVTVDGSTINLNGNTLHAGWIVLGASGSAGVLSRGGAAVEVQSVSLYSGSTFDIHNSDTLIAGGTIAIIGAGSAMAFNNNSATTFGQVSVYDGGSLDLQGGTLHATGFQIGYSTPGTVTRSGGLVDVTNLNLYGGATFNLAAGDSIDNVAVYAASTFDLSGNTLAASQLYVQQGSVARTGGGNVTLDALSIANDTSFSLISGDTINSNGSITVAGSNAVLDINTSLPNALNSTYVYDGATLNLNGNSLNTANLQLGNSSPGVLTRSGGALTVQSITAIAGSSLDILPADTLIAGGSVSVYSAGSTLNYDNLPAGTMGSVSVYNDGVLDLQGGVLRTTSLYLGSSTAGTITRSGGLLDVQSGSMAMYAGSKLDLAAGDNFTNASVAVYGAGTELRLNGTTLDASSLTTGQGGALIRGGGNFNVSTLQVQEGSALDVVTGDNIAANGNINVNGAGAVLDFNTSIANTLNSVIAYDGGVINLNGNTIHSGVVQVGSNTAGTLNRGGGTLEFQTINVFAGSTLDVAPADTVIPGGSITANNNSSLNWNNNSASHFSSVSLYEGASLNLQGGTLHTAYVYLSGSVPGSVIHSGGTLDVDVSLSVSSGCTYTLAAGDEFTGATINVQGPNATFALAGNNLDAAVLSLTGSTAAVTRVGGGNVHLDSTIQLFDGAAFSLIAGDTLTSSCSVNLYGNGSMLNVESGVDTEIDYLSASETGIVNLNGGTLTTMNGGNPITVYAGTTLNLNGTMLKAGNNHAAWIVGDPAATVQVQAGGAKFDTNGFDASISRPITHDPNVAIDGGLYKTGAGILDLSGNNTYNGPTIVHQGNLRASSINSLPGYNIPAQVTVDPGATLSVQYGGGVNDWTESAVNTLRANAALTAGSTLAFNVIDTVNTQTFSSDISGSYGIGKQGDGTLELTGALSYTGGTTVDGGTLKVFRLHENNPVNITAGGRLQVFDSSPTFPSHPSGDDAYVSQPSSLSIASGGTLDLGNNDMIIDYGAGTPYNGNSPAAAIEALIARGFNYGDWLGTGITSSAAASQDAAGNFVLAIVDNATLPQPYGVSNGGENFAGIDVPVESVLVKFTHRVDLNLDGLVSDADAIVFSTNYEAGSPATWSIGDLDYDGVFTGNDTIIFGTYYDTGLAHLPEPASVGAIAMAAAGLLARCRQRR